MAARQRTPGLRAGRFRKLGKALRYREIHIGVSVFSDSEEIWHDTMETVQRQYQGIAGVTVLSRQDFGAERGDLNPLGYKDSIGQRAIEGCGVEPLPGKGRPIKAGEFILGYPGEAGVPLPMPRPDVLGRNATFVGLRKYHSGVGTFNRFLAWRGPRRKGRIDKCGASADGADRGQAGRLAQERLRRLAGSTGRQPFGVYRALAAGAFYGFNRPGVESSDAIIENWWRLGMMGGAKAHYDGIVAFSQTDFTADLKKIAVPVLVMHRDDDQIVPYADSAPLSVQLVKNGTLTTYAGFPHGMPTTLAGSINADLLAFVQS
jgi:hypothetical protein